ncbi:chromophore lyase CpcT/CpeT [Winogradskyella echinorum]|uniref:Chromophore lyase CpcT/CpeT n=1 Tax=Winogradskyella echinorum TaxID=538189 RepID=A0ABR6Y4J6_9FLAO|nr:chromophore lyase CpcT/CpeT [Winogradskyella echinorum]MBC3847677.1 chromophore lyase CpcT/CpeT [Winogradskyella echinorum]MBC5752025.1 chromophore lyase CpcT/CpeT [Winogradskyella echinorum]
MKRFLPFLILIISITSCKNETKQELEEDTELKELFGLMQGSFNSDIQSQVDSSYYNISLHMYPIWEDKGNFLYVEQALTSMQNKPYRQRIYEIKRATDSTFSSAVYNLNVDSLWIGMWKTPKAFDSISINDIALKEGCEVILKRIAPNHFIGKTGDDTCVSTMRGASFARSEVEILEDKIMSWDRGFDADGNYVWGAEKGAYIFNKLD